jgi:predicted phosphodiesterase
LKRVAVITDIHGNLPALEASPDPIEQIGVDATYCGGNLVGYGPYPNEVCSLIAERGIPTIYGNYDYAIARDLDDCGCAYVTQARRHPDPPRVWLAAKGQRVSVRGQAREPV